MKKINWAVCGTGEITEKFLSTIKLFSNASVVACASSNIERARVFARTHNLIPYNYQELYDIKGIDAVYVCTNNNFHYQNTINLLNSNIPVLCEKPIATSYIQAKHMVDLALQKKVLLMDAMWTAYLPCTAAVKNLIERSAGNIKQINGKFTIPLLQKPSHRIFDKKKAGGVLLDLGCYLIFYTYTLLGNPKKITAKAVKMQNGVDTSTQIVLEYANSVLANLECSVGNDRVCQFDITTENGIIKVNNFNGATSFKFIEHCGKISEYNFDLTLPGFWYEIEHFMKILETGKLQSDILTHNSTLQYMSILSQCQDQILDKTH
jgi:predicted dehydrogenase